jgi:hypothetical protein
MHRSSWGCWLPWHSGNHQGRLRNDRMRAAEAAADRGPKTACCRRPEPGRLEADERTHNSHRHSWPGSGRGLDLGPDPDPCLDPVGRCYDCVLCNVSSILLMFCLARVLTILLVGPTVVSTEARSHRKRCVASAMVQDRTRTDRRWWWGLHHAGWVDD